MTDRRVTRRLAAVLASDVVKFSAMMSRDEVGTLAALKEHREQVFNPIVESFRGRIIKLMGDGALVEFVSVVDALECAVAVQRALVADPDITLRIGINLGDVIIDDDDIYGNGVNIAARLEPLASPGGLCVSSVVKESIGRRLNVVFADGGLVGLKNIEEPVHIWHWNAEASAPSPSTRQPSSTSAPENSGEVSIAVMPFDNMSGHADQEYFSDGISEDIITDLSKISGMKVIARNSSFAYKGEFVDLRLVGRELGVTNILEGSVRRVGDRIRINAQLIEAENGTHIWAERYDRKLTDIFELQDEVTLAMVDALKVVLKPGEFDRIARQATESVEAYDHYLRADSLLNSPGLNAEMVKSAVGHCGKALDFDPKFAEVYAMLALCHYINYQNAWTESSQLALDIAKEAADKAVKIGSFEPVVYQAQALISQVTGDFAQRNQAIERALELGPNNAYSLFLRAMFAIYGGQPDTAFDDLEKAMRLEPNFAHEILHFTGLAHFFLGRYEAALLIFRERLIIDKSTSNGRVLLASTLGHIGRVDEAKDVWKDLRHVHPDFSYSKRLEMLPYEKPEYPAQILEGLAKAGVADE